jgi:hypothetical protein
VNEKVIKYLIIFVGIVVIWSYCSEPNPNEHYDVNVQTMVSASEGLNLKAVGELMKKSKDAETLEKLINSKDESVNNLDLNEDGKVDYIQVTEYGNDKLKGFSLTVKLSADEVQEVATIEVEKTSDANGQMEIRGNEQIYGQRHYHHSHFGFTDFLIMSYLFSPHRMWASPHYYGSYPNYHNPYNTVSHTHYRNTVSQKYGNSSFRNASNRSIQSTIKSPNAGKSAKSIKAPLKRPTASQKSFQARNPSKQVRSGGFGRSVRSSSSRRSGSYSRGGK